MCQNCLNALGPMAAKALTVTSPTERAAAFSATCPTLGGLSPTACNAVLTTILAGTSNLVARAGAMCASLGQCPATGCPSLTNGASLTGSLDLCTAEGISGGTPTPLPNSVPATNSSLCRSIADCTSGQMCTIEDPVHAPRSCTCSAGRDECVPLGTCVAFCSLNSTATKLAALNAGVSSCDPSAANPQCGADEECKAPSATGSTCSRWTCDAAGQKLVQAPCSGLCVPRVLSMTAAQLSDDGKSVTVTLGGYAAARELVSCSKIFDANSTAALGGAGALCSVRDNVLTAKMTPAATLTVGAGS